MPADKSFGALALWAVDTAGRYSECATRHDSLIEWATPKK